MRIVFMGSPEFAVPTLRALVDSRHSVVAVVTQPDRPAGRGHGTTPPPAKAFAQERGLAVLQPVNVSSPVSVERLKGVAPDVIVVAAYGQILRERVLEIPTRGSLNVHASLLPRHRGASPIAAAILAGDAITGVTVMEVVRALDAGPMIAKVEVPISAHDSTGSLEPRLADAGARLLVETLDDWAAGRIQAQPQDDALSTYAPMLRRPEARIEWALPAADIWRRVRAFNPWPAAFTAYGGSELRVLEAWPLDGDLAAAPGTVLPPETMPADYGALSEAPVVQTGAGRLALLQVQMAGKRATSGVDFSRGQRGFVGSRLGG